MVELTLVGVRIELPTQTPIVLLKERDGERFLPIWIGNVEATAIAFALQGVATQRPLTHDLLKNLLDELVVSIERIVITELKEGTFYATIELQAERLQVLGVEPAERRHRPRGPGQHAHLRRGGRAQRGLHPDQE